MIILMQLDASASQIESVCTAVREQGLDPLVLPGEDRVAIGIPAVVGQDDRPRLEALFSSLDGVSKVTQVSRPYKLASLEFQRQKTTVTVGEASFGPGSFSVMGGPCSIESYEQLSECARLVKAAGCTMLRGGAFKPRTSPYSFQGLAEEGLKIMQTVGRENGIATITEVMSADMVGLVAGYVDMLQIGARSMQNFPLLVEAGRSGKPVMLKRGSAATIDEFLLAAEYVLNQGNPNVVLCERGVIPLDRAYVRNTFDIGAIPVLLEHTHLPVIADPSHGIGVARYVEPMALAAVAAGANGLMIEMHPNPKVALSDGSQALGPTQFNHLMEKVSSLQSFLHS